MLLINQVETFKQALIKLKARLFVEIALLDCVASLKKGATKQMTQMHMCKNR